MSSVCACRCMSIIGACRSADCAKVMHGNKKTSANEGNTLTRDIVYSFRAAIFTGGCGLSSCDQRRRADLCPLSLYQSLSAATVCYAIARLPSMVSRDLLVAQTEEACSVVIEDVPLLLLAEKRSPLNHGNGTFDNPRP